MFNVVVVIELVEFGEYIGWGVFYVIDGYWVIFFEFDFNVRRFIRGVFRVYRSREYIF